MSEDVRDPIPAELLPRVYDELRRVAAGYLGRERGAHTLQPTALVHEAYLRLADDTGLDVADPDHFGAIAARVMRRVLVDHARRRSSLKRGEGRQLTVTVSFAEESGSDVDVLALHDALDKLAALNERQASIAEMRFFADLSVEQAAAQLGVSPRTVKGDWRVARAWLQRELGHAL